MTCDKFVTVAAGKFAALGRVCGRRANAWLPSSGCPGPDAPPVTFFRHPRQAGGAQPLFERTRPARASARNSETSCRTRPLAAAQHFADLTGGTLGPAEQLLESRDWLAPSRSSPGPSGRCQISSGAEIHTDLSIRSRSSMPIMVGRSTLSSGPPRSRPQYVSPRTRVIRLKVRAQLSGELSGSVRAVESDRANTGLRR